MPPSKRQKLRDADDSPSREYHFETGTNASKPRLTRACAECKKLKIKCFVQPGQTACNKCLKNGIHCVPHNFAQKFMDQDAEYESSTLPLRDAHLTMADGSMTQPLSFRSSKVPSSTSFDTIACPTWTAMTPPHTGDSQRPQIDIEDPSPRTHHH